MVFVWIQWVIVVGEIFLLICFVCVVGDMVISGYFVQYYDNWCICCVYDVVIYIEFFFGVGDKVGFQIDIVDFQFGFEIWIECGGGSYFIFL